HLPRRPAELDPTQGGYERRDRGIRRALVDPRLRVGVLAHIDISSRFARFTKRQRWTFARSALAFPASQERRRPGPPGRPHMARARGRARRGGSTAARPESRRTRPPPRSPAIAAAPASPRGGAGGRP